MYVLFGGYHDYDGGETWLIGASSSKEKLQDIENKFTNDVVSLRELCNNLRNEYYDIEPEPEEYVDDYIKNKIDVENVVDKDNFNYILWDYGVYYRIEECEDY